jgi:H/ACA ribonucleoprotein complex subunit 3
VTRSLMQWCRSCHVLTLKPRCPECGADTVNPLPPKYSPEDPYGKYRREMKRRVQEDSKQVR